MHKGGVRRWLTVAAVGVVIVVGVGALLLGHTPLRRAPGPGGDAFPQIDRPALSPAHRRIIDVLQAQFEAQPPAQHFSEGADEPWCADFVSWVLNEAGEPLSNPNSGHWRIPGVYTLQESFEAAGRFVGPGGYLPQPGDVVMYSESSPMGLHTNFAMAVRGDEITTVGGNEEGGIRVDTVTLGPEGGILGFGRTG